MSTVYPTDATKVIGNILHTKHNCQVLDGLLKDQNIVQITGFQDCKSGNQISYLRRAESLRLILQLHFRHMPQTFMHIIMKLQGSCRITIPIFNQISPNWHLQQRPSTSGLRQSLSLILITSTSLLVGAPSQHLVAMTRRLGGISSYGT